MDPILKKIFGKNNPTFTEDLHPHRNTIIKLLSPTIDIVLDDSPISPGNSNIQGLPDLPSNFTWPSVGDLHYNFLAQFNFSEVNHQCPQYPKTGMLSIFFAEQYYIGTRTDQEDVPHFKLFYFNDVELIQTSLPYEPNQHKKSSRVKLESGYVLPYCEIADPKFAWMNGDEGIECDYMEFYYENFQCNTKGYFGTTVFGGTMEDPTPEPFENWTQLLRLQTIDDLGIHWGDLHTLMIFVEKNKLSKLDFSNIFSIDG